jgi:hypothetical protein
MERLLGDNIYDFFTNLMNSNELVWDDLIKSFFVKNVHEGVDEYKYIFSAVNETLAGESHSIDR